MTASDTGAQVAEQRPGGFTIEESARRLGHYRWIEMRLFELLGRWVAETPEVDVKLRFAASSRHHGWHAELLAERLPEVRDLSPDRQTVAPNDELADVVLALDALAGDDLTTSRLVAVYRVVVPHLVAAYSWHIDRCGPAADAAVRRTLGFLVADLIDDWNAAEQVLQTGPPTTEHVERRAAVRTRFESMLAASGGISGPSTFVGPG